MSNNKDLSGVSVDIGEGLLTISELVSSDKLANSMVL